MKYLLRVAPSLAAVAVFGFLCSAASAADKAASDKTAADKDHAGAATEHSVVGRIENIDATKRIITLTNVKPWHGDKGAGAAADRPATTDRAAGADRPATTDRERTAAGDANKATGADGAHNAPMMVQVAENAKITLDGKPAQLSDLKDNMYARVYLHHGAHSGGADKGGTSGGAATDRDRTAAGDANGTAGAGRVHMTDRIDAHTHAPAEAGSSTGTKEK